MKAWDEYTMQHEPIASIDLMERAAQKVVEWIEQRNWKTRTIRIFCGRGNNGGDGLAVGRILLQKGYNCFVYVIQNRRTGSPDFEANLKRIQTSSNNNVRFIAERNQLPFIEKDAIIIDALFGSGLNKPVEGLNASVVDHLNRSGATIVSVDVPTGLFANEASKGQQIIEADFTLTFQSYKPALLIQENAAFIGNVHLLDIGLHPQFTPGTTDILIDDDLVRSLYRPRGRFAHKGNFGHALLIAGSFGKMGAAVLAAKACLRAGVGLLSCFLPRCGYTIMQAAVPEAMVMVDENETNIGQLPEEIEKYSVIGIGPGIGTAETTQKMITFIVRRYRKPLVIDADALNCLSLQKELLSILPPGSILTPHPKEFDRIFGNHQNDFARIQTARKKAKDWNIIIVLKGHHSFIATPEQCYFNSTGNAGMAKGGSGDVLTGILTALMAQGYRPRDAAVFGVYMHGFAGDIAASALSEEGMLPSDLVSRLPEAFKSFSQQHRGDHH